ncbi:MAG: sulfite exporter TauE/SafE family protein [Pseudonocardia sp.]
MDVGLVLGGLAVGVVVGLIGMGGGALMTPMLVFCFGVNPLAAVSSDLVTAAAMKPFGGPVHAMRRTVSWSLVGWLALGSVPSGFAGVLVLRALGGTSNVDVVVTTALGAALLVASAALVVKAYVSLSRRSPPDEPLGASSGARLPVTVRPVPTVLVGVVGGLVVGMTSVGSGSLMIIALMLLYPVLRPGQLVGTDLVQAVPLVAAAAMGHLIYGDVQLAVTGTLLLGSIPGTILGAMVSSRAPAGLVRRALAVVLLASGLKLLSVPTSVTAAVLVACLILGPLAWMGARKWNGLVPSPFAAKHTTRWVEQARRSAAV